jgi:hypothetical protein
MTGKNAYAGGEKKVPWLMSLTVLFLPPIPSSKTLAFAQEIGKLGMLGILEAFVRVLFS